MRCRCPGRRCGGMLGHVHLLVVAAAPRRSPRVPWWRVPFPALFADVDHWLRSLHRAPAVSIAPSAGSQTDHRRIIDAAGWGHAPDERTGRTHRQAPCQPNPCTKSGPALACAHSQHTRGSAKRARIRQTRADQTDGGGVGGTHRTTCLPRRRKPMQRQRKPLLAGGREMNRRQDSDLQDFCIDVYWIMQVYAKILDLWQS